MSHKHKESLIVSVWLDLDLVMMKLYNIFDEVGLVHKT